MKASYVVVMSVLLGLLLGAGITWARFGNPPLSPLPHDIEGSAAQVAAAAPKLWIDQRSHDFGAIERDIEVRHVFHIKNTGQGTLTLREAGTSCSRCTVAEVDRTEVGPGESANVTVAYMPGDQSDFRQKALIVTNDLNEPRIELGITGRVTTRYEVVPPSLVLSKISATETRRAEVRIFAFFSDSLEVVSHEFAEAETASFFEAKILPISPEQLAERKAKSGCSVELTVKPGLPLGPFRQTIRLQIRLSGTEETPTIRVPIAGIIDSDISLVGSGWNADAGRLAIGDVKISEGTTRRLLLLVRGAGRHEVTIKPVSREPDWVKVTVGEPSELSSGAVTQIPLTIEIPPDAPPANHLGTEQGKYGEVILETTHADIKQIRMYLQFVTVP